jgi:hypothetical protein
MMICLCCVVKSWPLTFRIQTLKENPVGDLPQGTENSRQIVVRDSPQNGQENTLANRHSIELPYIDFIM